MWTPKNVKKSVGKKNKVLQRKNVGLLRKNYLKE